MPDVDQTAVRELVLFAENDGTLYRQSTEPVQKNLLRKAGKGEYDHGLAGKLWAYHAGRAFQRYEAEFGKGSLGTRPSNEFIGEVAKKFADDFADENDLPKSVNPKVVRFGKEKRSTFTVGEPERRFTGTELARRFLSILNRPSNTRGGISGEVLLEAYQRRHGSKPSGEDARNAMKYLLDNGYAETFSAPTGQNFPSTRAVLRSVPSSRRSKLVKNSTAVIPIKVGNNDAGTIVGRVKVDVRGDLSSSKASGKTIRKTVVRPPKATEKAWTVTVTSRGPTGDIARRENLTLREAKSFARNAITGKGKGRIRREV